MTKKLEDLLNLPYVKILYKGKWSQEIQDKYQEYFEKIYTKYGFSDNITAWSMMKDFLIDGYLSIEIVYDDKKKG